MKRIFWTFSSLIVAGAAFALAQPPAGPGGGGPGGGRPSRPIIEALDADHDGEISAEEIKNAPISLLTLDKNKDGKLTEDEYRPQGGRPGGLGGGPPGEGRGPGGPGEARGEGRGGPPGAGGQGQAPNAERMLAHSMEFDEDKDGKLSKEEMEKFIADFSKRRGPGAGGPGAGGPGAGGPPGGGPRENAGGPGGRPGEGSAKPERPRRPE